MPQQPQQQSQPQHRVRLNSLTSLRYFAAIAVVFAHVYYQYISWRPLWVATYYGYIGVSFFYMLSGFVLTWSCARQPARKFWWNRFARIWPLQAVMMIVMYYVYWCWQAANHPTSPLGWILQVFLLQSWDPHKNVYSGGDGPVWSLSCEMFFYALFPLIILFVRKARARGLAITAVAVIAVMIAAPIAVGPHISAATFMWMFFYMPGYRIGEFILGMLLARAVALGLRLRHPWVGYTIGWSWLVFWAAAAAKFTIDRGYVDISRPWVALTVAPAFLLLLLSGVSADLSGRSRLMNAKVMIKLGEWSFALYLVHIVFVDCETRYQVLANHGGLRGLTYFAIFLAVATAAGAVAHYTIEKPAERWLRRLMQAPARPADDNPGEQPAEPVTAGARPSPSGAEA